MDVCGRLADGGGDVTEGRLKCLSPPIRSVNLMTAFGTTESAVEAMKAGAADYLLKGNYS
jgi:DNA-binding NtrC family response regulator